MVVGPAPPQLRHRRGPRLDAQTTGPESEALAQLIVGCVLRAAARGGRRRNAAGPARPPDRGEPVARDALRARRAPDRPRGAADRGVPAAQALDRLHDWSGVDAPLPEANGAQRQRRMIEAGARPAEVYTQTVEETQATYQGDSPVSPPRSRRSARRRCAQSRPRCRGSRSTTCCCRRSSRCSTSAPARPGWRRRPPRQAPEPDLEQVRQAVEGARALLPLVEERHDEQLGPVRDALSRLQMFYAQRSGGQASRRPGEPAAKHRRRSPAPGRPRAPDGSGSRASRPSASRRASRYTARPPATAIRPSPFALS